MDIFFCSSAQNFVYGEQPGFEATCDVRVTLGHCFWEKSVTVCYVTLPNVIVGLPIPTVRLCLTYWINPPMPITQGM